MGMCGGHPGGEPQGATGRSWVFPPQPPPRRPFLTGAQASLCLTAGSSLLPLPSLPRKYVSNTSQLQVQLGFRGHCSARSDSVRPHGL